MTTHITEATKPVDPLHRFVETAKKQHPGLKILSSSPTAIYAVDDKGIHHKIKMENGQIHHTIVTIHHGGEKSTVHEKTNRYEHKKGKFETPKDAVLHKDFVPMKSSSTGYDLAPMKDNSEAHEHWKDHGEHGSHGVLVGNDEEGKASTNFLHYGKDHEPHEWAKQHSSPLEAKMHANMLHHIANTTKERSHVHKKLKELGYQKLVGSGDDDADTPPVNRGSDYS